MDHFLERHNVPKLTQVEIDKLNRPISEIDSLNLRKLKAPGPDGFTGNSTKHLRKKLHQYSPISSRRQKQKI